MTAMVSFRQWRMNIPSDEGAGKKSEEKTEENKEENKEENLEENTEESAGRTLCLLLYIPQVLDII